MYLKEGDIGKAESEEVVPRKTETEVVSQAGLQAGPLCEWLAPACGQDWVPGQCARDWVSGLGANCRADGGPTPGELYPRSSFNLHSHPGSREKMPCYR